MTTAIATPPFVTCRRPWHGFTFSAAWGEDDYWDTSLRYAGEFNGIRIAAGIGYKQQNDNPGKTGSDGDHCADLNAGRSAGQHCRLPRDQRFGQRHARADRPLPHGAYARYTDENRKALYGNIAGIKDEDTYWTLMSGIEQNWFGIGKTTLYGEYARHEVGAGLSTGGPRVR